MLNLSADISLYLLDFCDIHSFVKIAQIDKKSLQNIKYYFHIKKLTYEKYNIEKNIYNCLLKKKICNHMGNKTDKNEIVKVIKLKNKAVPFRGMDIHIYYWCISSPKIIGKKHEEYTYVIYPNHEFIFSKDINDNTLIPFR